MALTTKAATNKVAKDEAENGEIRKDELGVPYWYSFKNDESPTPAPEPEPAPVEEPAEPESE